MTDILLNDSDDLEIINGDFATGESLTQDVSLILRLNQGELKEDPVLGPGLIRQINGTANKQKLKGLMRLHLERDGKSWDDLNDLINTTIKKH